MGVSSVDVTEPMTGGQIAGKQIPRIVAYLIGCFCTLTMGGGIILGSGPFATAMTNEGYIEGSDVPSLFVVAFQMLTWGTVLAAHLLGRLGPRMTALIGVCISVPGMVTFAIMPNPVAPIVATLAYGLIGAGGNHIYLSTFHFAQLFPDRLGLADGIIAGLFNAAGLMLLVLNIPGTSISGIFTAWLFVAAGVFVLIFLFYPDKEYRGEDIATLSRISFRHAKNPLNCSEYGRNFKGLLNLRYFLFVFSFSLTSNISTWVNGVLVGDLFDSIPPPDAYKTWAQPLACNSTVLFTWIVGSLIDKFGFAPTGFVQASMAAILTTLSLFRDSMPAAWLSLLFLNWTNAALYTQQFVFLHKVFHGEIFITALLTTLVVQACMLFIASPGLTSAFPVDYSVPSGLLLGSCVLLFFWPLAEMLTFRKMDLAAVSEDPERLASRSVLGSIIGPALADGSHP